MKYINFHLLELAVEVEAGVNRPELVVLEDERLDAGVQGYGHHL